MKCYCRVHKFTVMCYSYSTKLEDFLQKNKKYISIHSNDGILSWRGEDAPKERESQFNSNHLCTSCIHSRNSNFSLLSFLTQCLVNELWWLLNQARRVFSFFFVSDIFGKFLQKSSLRYFRKNIWQLRSKRT